MAIMFPAIGGEFEVYVNGAPIFEEAAEGAYHIALSGMRPILLELDPHFFHARVNRIDVVVSGAPNRAISGGFWLGPLSESPVIPGPPADLAIGGRFLTWSSAIAGLLVLLAGFFSGRGRAHILGGIVLVSLAIKSLAASPVFIDALGAYWIILDRSALCAAFLASGAWLAAENPVITNRIGQLGLLVLGDERRSRIWNGIERL